MRESYARSCCAVVTKAKSGGVAPTIDDGTAPTAGCEPVPFDFESADFLEKMNVCAYKIASADLVNLPLIEHVAKKNKPLILSTGMSKISEIDEAIETVRSTGNNNLAI